MFPDRRQAELEGWRRRLHRGENLLLTAALAALVLLPLVEALLRKLFRTGLSGASAIVQHLVLVVCMLGGLAAAREGRLLALSTVRQLLVGRWKSAARVIGGAFAAGVSVFLCAASVSYIALTRSSGKIVAYGFPVWVVQLVPPIAFALIALRLTLRAGERTTGRLVSAGLAGLLVFGATFSPVDPAHLVGPGLALVVLAAILGAPIFTVLGGAALILFWGQETPIATLALNHYQMVVNPSLAAIPLFTLAGYFLAEGGASRRLIRVFRALVGGVRGGPAILTALVCAFFTSFTGASGVTILALGGLLMPVLLSARYTERNAIGLLTGAGSLGLLFPPALPLILYAVVATTVGSTVSMKQMFLGGIVPGMLLVSLTAVWGVMQAPRRARPAAGSFDPRELGRAVGDAKWELGLPLVALVALFGGFATPVEAAAITALYAFVIETLVYRDLDLRRKVPETMAECGLLVGGVLLILGVAMGFTNYLVDARIPDRAVEWAQGSIESQWVFLLTLNAFLLVVGCLMDVFSAIVVVVPLIVPVAAAFGIDPIHLGIIFLANLELGYLTPPVGMNLFLSAYRFDKPVPVVMRSVLPMFVVLLLGVLLITYLPMLTTTLPSLFE
jgi:tripartite ATP-independent transporter DctM subunit